MLRRGQSTINFFSKIFYSIRFFRRNLQAAVSKYIVQREVAKVLLLTHAQELAVTPRNEWPLVRSKQVEEIKAVQSGQQFDIVDRRSWSYPYLPEALHRLNQPILKSCFSADTEILTKRGWVLISEIGKGDFVASRMLDGTAEWVPVKKLFRYKYKGKMIHFHGMFVDLLVSPDHKMYGRYRSASNVWNGCKECPECGNSFRTTQAMGAHRRKIHWIEAKSEGLRENESYSYSELCYPYAKDVTIWLKEHRSSVYSFEIPVATKWGGKFPRGYDAKTDTIPLKRYVPTGGKVNHWKSESVRVNLKDLVAFIGIYVAEGSVRGSYFGMDVSSDSKKPHYVQAIAAAADLVDYLPAQRCVRVAQNKTSKYFGEIEELLDRLPWKFEYDRTNFGVNDKNLYRVVVGMGNTYTKKIPSWVKNLPPEYLNIFLEWHRKGDGITTNDGVEKHYTVSKQLADDLQEVLQRAGAEAGLRTIKQTGSKKWKLKAERQAPLYEVTKHNFQFKGITNFERNIGEVEYDDYIYCPAIPPYETVYVRRNGKASWCGRTPYNL